MTNNIRCTCFEDRPLHTRTMFRTSFNVRTNKTAPVIFLYIAKHVLYALFEIMLMDFYNFLNFFNMFYVHFLMCLQKRKGSRHITRLSHKMRRIVRNSAWPRASQFKMRPILSFLLTKTKHQQFSLKAKDITAGF